MSRSIARSFASGNGMCKVMVNAQERWMMEWQVSRCQCALVAEAEPTLYIVSVERHREYPLRWQRANFKAS